MASSFTKLNTEHGTIKTSASTTASGFPTSIRIIPATTVPTDIWRKPGPPKIDTFNSPILYRAIPLSKFQSVRVKVSAKWSKQYDQGGLVFILPAPSNDKKEERKWVKTGIEFYEGREYVSTVGCDRWADWSLVDGGIKDVEGGEGGREVELLIELREKDNTLWVFVVDGERKIPMREVTWVSSGGGEREVWIGVYAATPTGMEKGAREELEVRFEGLEFGVKN